MLQTLDVSHNSLSGLVPNALLGISASGTTPAARPFPSLTYAKIFQQWGSRMCAHVRSSDDIPTVPPRLDLGNESSQVTSDVLKYMKSQPGPISSTESQACDSAASADAMLRAVSSQLAEHSRDWLRAGAGQMPATTPFVVLPRDQDDIIRPKEVFIGLCDLPEMVSLACVPDNNDIAWQIHLAPWLLYSTRDCTSWYLMYVVWSSDLWGTCPQLHPLNVGTRSTSMSLHRTGHVKRHSTTVSGQAWAAHRRALLVLMFRALQSWPKQRGMICLKESGQLLLPCRTAMSPCSHTCPNFFVMGALRLLYPHVFISSLDRLFLS